MSWARDIVGRIGRYSMRFMEAGVRHSIRILAGRLVGYVRWPANHWSRWRRHHLGPKVSVGSAEAVSAVDESFAVFWSQQDLDEICSVLRTDPLALGDRLVRRAEAMLSDGVPLLGFGRAYLRRPIAWHVDLGSGTAWPSRFHKFIDIVRPDAHCDVKFPWELSRLQCLPVIAGAWLVTRDARYSEKAWEIILDWSAQNPEGFGINWTCSMEVAIRAINLATAANLISSSLSSEQKRFMGRLLGAHERHIRWNLEISDVSGNHLFFDYLGIALLSLVLCGPHSGRFQRDAELLASETDAQFHPDGVHIEHATGYQRLVLEGVLLFLLATGRRGVQIESPLRIVAKRALPFLEAICDSGGALPSVGDSDSGNVLTLGDISGNHSAQLLELYAATALGGPAAKRCLDASTHVWFAHGTWQQEHELPRSVQDVQTTLRHDSFGNSGYYVIRGAGMLLLLRAGPSGLGGRGSHDHNDQLSMVLSMNGRPILIDPGTSTYTGDLNQHAWDLATAHHNTVALEGLEQSPILRGSVTCAVRNAPGTCESFVSDAPDRVTWRGTVPYGIEAEGQTVHSRLVSVSVVASDTLQVEIRDSIRGNTARRRPACANFLIHPDCRVATQGLSAIIEADAREMARLDVQVGGAPILVPDTAALEYGKTWKTTRISVPLGDQDDSLIRLSLRSDASALPRRATSHAYQIGA